MGYIPLSCDGTIYAIAPMIDVNGRALRIRARVPDPDGRLSPGLFARIQIIVERRTDALITKHGNPDRAVRQPAPG